MQIIIIVIITVLALIFFKFYSNLKKKYQDPIENVEKKKSEPSPLSFNKKNVEEVEIACEYGKIYLQPLTLLDEKPLSVLMSNAAVVEPLGLSPIKKFSQLKPIFQDYLDTLNTYGIFIKSSDRLVGVAQFEAVDTTTVKAWFFLGRQFWNHGFGEDTFEALENLIKEDGYKTIIANVKIDENNKAFLEVMGFEEIEGRYEYKI